MNRAIYDNGNTVAFPSTEIYRECDTGFTKRELIAAMAMQGRIANGDKWDEDNIAQYAVQQADALLAHLAAHPLEDKDLKK